MGCGFSRNNVGTNSAALIIGEILYEASVKYDNDNNLEDAIGRCNKARQLIQSVDANDKANYSIMISCREGGFYYRGKRYQKAVEAFINVISLSETIITERSKGIYVVLQRYMECMCDLARIWKVEADAESKEAANNTGDSNNNKKGIYNPKTIQAYSKCELTLLRCIEAIEEAHNRRSDLLIEPLSLLSELYETLGLFGRAELFTRRTQGILIVQYGYSHPAISSLLNKLDRLSYSKDTRMEDLAAVKIQSIFRMRVAMVRVGKLLGKTMVRHTLVPYGVLSMGAKEDGGFLGTYCKRNVPIGTETGYSEGTHLIEVDNSRDGSVSGHGNPLVRAVGTPRIYEGLHSINM